MDKTSLVQRFNSIAAFVDIHRQTPSTMRVLNKSKHRLKTPVWFSHTFQHHPLRFLYSQPAVTLASSPSLRWARLLSAGFLHFRIRPARTLCGQVDAQGLTLPLTRWSVYVSPITTLGSYLLLWPLGSFFFLNHFWSLKVCVSFIVSVGCFFCLIYAQ